MHLLDQLRIAGEALRIEIAHLVDERLHLGAGFGAVLHDGFYAVQEVEALLDFALRVGGSGAGVWIAEAPPFAVASEFAARAYCTAHRAAATIGDLTIVDAAIALASLPAVGAALLAALLAARLSTLLTAWLLSRLTVAGELSALVLTLAAAALSGLLSIGLLTIGLLSATETAELIAQAREIVHRAIERSFLGVGPAAFNTGAERAGGIAHLIAELLEIAGQRGFGLIGEVAFAQQVRTALHSRIEVGIVETLQSAAQLAGGVRLSGRELALGVAQLLGEALQIVSRLLAVVDHFVDLRRGDRRGLLAGGTSSVLLVDEIADVVGLLLLASGKLLGILGERVQLPAGILLLETAEKISGLAKAIGGAAGIR